TGKASLCRNRSRAWSCCGSQYRQISAVQTWGNQNHGSRVPFSVPGAVCALPALLPDLLEAFDTSSTYSHLLHNLIFAAAHGALRFLASKHGHYRRGQIALEPLFDLQFLPADGQIHSSAERSGKMQRHIAALARSVFGFVRVGSAKKVIARGARLDHFL